MQLNQLNQNTKRLKSKTFNYVFAITTAMHTAFYHSPGIANAQFFAKGEAYANQVFPLAGPITLLIFGAIRIIFIYLIGARSVKIVSGGRGEDKVSDLATEVAILFVTILVVDVLLDLIIP